MVQLTNLNPQSLSSSAPSLLLRSAIRNCNAGFTLIEVLIATMILSALVYLATLSYSMFLTVWEKKRLTDTSAINDYRSHILVRSALESIYDYYVTDPANEKVGRYYPFFKGKRDMLEFVTLSSVFSKGFPAIARLKLERQDMAAGEHCNVIYQEAPLDQIYIKYADVKPEYSHTIIVYTEVKKINIRYYGEWETRWIPERDNFDTVYRWQDTFHGEKRNTIPEIIELTISTEAAETTLLFPVIANNVYKRAFFHHAL
ncbi:MAG: prepilin-type N-terminal cleavage/methylation domain-containing protein [Desulfobacteraceae bacterium]|nr:prepilin-type N-terminal cleavage/methylation domain-containing protein [Desulfobacteraceae bacterium]MBC2720730.1 prepilin-type N-terminal cleavage/methylation domain-containing protein [Desulfobacteraceae bacterium]